MKVALFPSAFYPSLGGIEELVNQVARELHRRGDDPIVLVNRWPRSLPAREDLDGLPVHRLPMRVPTRAIKAKVSYFLTHRVIRQRVVRLLREHGTDLIHVHGVSCNTPYALYAKAILNLPLIVTLHAELTMDPNQAFQRDPRAASRMITIAESADLITAVSNKTLADAEEFCGTNFGPRGRVILNGADIELFRAARAYQHSRPYILAMGRMVPQKGFDLLLQAFAAAKLGDLDLLIAGDGPESDRLQILADELEITSRVHLLGRVDRAKAASLYRGSEFFVIPSRADEGMPLVAIEAMAAGCAIIGTRSGGLPEVVKAGETGLIIERNDVSGLTEQIRRLANDPQLTRKLAEAGRERASQFSWPVITEQYLDVYRNVLHSRDAIGASDQLATA